ncbi:MAG: a-factor receptor [Vezdaea aestivalis]|nr:MAG: a-factor receptor [Vezdaea aestivalis]
MADMPSLSSQRSATAIIIPVLSFLSILSTLPPLVWHWQNRNVAACSLIIWISFAATIFIFTNALIWPTDDVTTWWNGHVFCDIQAKIQWPAIGGISASLCAVMRNLAKVMEVDRNSIIPSKAERRRALAADLVLCWGYPILFIPLHYVVQPNRYDISTVSGCIATYDESWPSIVLAFIWPPIFCALTCYYSVLVITRLIRYRKQFSEVMSSCEPSINKSRFLRLFIMAMILLVVNFPIQIYLLYRNLAYPLNKYSWSEIHGPEWNTIHKIPTGGQVVFDRWLKISAGFLVFFCFGLGTDALRMYCKWLRAIGLGRCIPGLTESRRYDDSYGSQSSSGVRSAASFSSKARLVFKSKPRSFFKTSFSAGPSNVSINSRQSSFSGATGEIEPKRTFSSTLAPIHEPRPPPGSPARGPSPSVVNEKLASSRRHSWLNSATLELQPAAQSEVVTDAWGGSNQGEYSDADQGVRIVTHIRQTEE